MSSFMKFIQTGMLGEISLGLKRDTVKALLGEPQDISVSSTPYILKYGSLQLSFSSNDPHATLQSVHLYFDEIVEFPHGLQLEGWLPNKSVSAEQFFIHAEHFNVVLEEDEQHTFKNLQIGFKSKADVIVVFMIEEESAKLYSIHFLGKRSRKKIKNELC
ncbi:hypothetical protein C8Z91_01050 [Paenibacillus elgii]|uniref:Uncharacterized protein n=2 Tax=Paenibacillus elgii TaxID=189691 RepID=A0A2T6GA46_9BACL|nr:hypothetical protein C8Z91_01050 [Paenibacillus elgii]